MLQSHVLYRCLNQYLTYQSLYFIQSDATPRPLWVTLCSSWGTFYFFFMGGLLFLLGNHMFLFWGPYVSWGTTCWLMYRLLLFEDCKYELRVMLHRLSRLFICLFVCCFVLPVVAEGGSGSQGSVGADTNVSAQAQPETWSWHWSESPQELWLDDTVSLWARPLCSDWLTQFLYEPALWALTQFVPTLSICRACTTICSRNKFNITPNIMHL